MLALRPETVAIHAGRGPRMPGSPVNPPLVPASTFFAAGYARAEGSPGWAPFEEAMGALEGGVAVAFGSGMAAISAVLETVPVGGRVVGPSAGYAWTRSLLARFAEAGRIELVGVDTTDTAATLRACEGASLLYVETPSNPLVEIAELDALCAAPCAVAVDGTFASPLLQRALSFGADFAIQSATKFIGGHSDLMLGVVTSTSRSEELHHIRAQLGALPVRSRPTSRCGGCARCRCGSRSPSAPRRSSPSASRRDVSCTTRACRPTRGSSGRRG